MFRVPLNVEDAWLFCVGLSLALQGQEESVSELGLKILAQAVKLGRTIEVHLIANTLDVAVDIGPTE